ncbi:MAG: MmgE/PrpD family protein [Chloroflexi bacterium]|nr:MmgE/PrpD family protein [Chloroflexota bacterium]
MKASSNPTASQQLAEFVTTARFEDLPEEVVGRAKELIIDHLGVSIYGSTTPWARMMVNLVANERAIGGSSIYLSKVKTVPRNAALVNGTTAHGFELDDVLHPVHSGAVVIPAALAIGEQERASGKELIAAIVLGYEVMARIASAVHDSKFHALGRHGTGVLGAFGAATAAGRLLNLDCRTLVSAIGLAANQHTGLMEFFREGTMEKRFFAGKASHDGVLAATMAASGFSAATTSLDGEYGFCRVFDREANLTTIAENLGETFRLMETEIKPYPCCRVIHALVDAALRIAETYDLPPQDIREVLIHGSKGHASSRHAYYEIPDVMAAQFSIPYCVARALVYHKLWVDDFTPGAIKDPQTLALMPVIKVIPDAEMERNREMATWSFRSLSVKLADGKVIEETGREARGSPGSTLFTDDLYRKFGKLGLMVLPGEKVDNIMGLVHSLPQMGDVAELANAMSS